jgi:cytoskeleton protein RodZ
MDNFDSPRGGSTLGEFLRVGRQRAGLALEQISAETKIPLYHLRALESESLDVLPGGLYVRAEVRAYARVVGVDQNAALARLEHLLKPRHQIVASPPLRSPIASPKNVTAGVSVVAVVLVFGLFANQQERNVTPVPITTSAKPAAPLNVATTPEPGQQLAIPVLDNQQPESPIAKTTGETEDEAQAANEGRQTELRILSQPPGARVTVDGIGWGETPVTVRNLPPGAKRIRVTKAGYRSEERVAHLPEDRPATLRVSLHTTP